MPRSIVVFSLSMLCQALAAAQEPASTAEVKVADAVKDQQDILVHAVTSPYQSAATEIRVLLPEKLEEAKRYPVVYVLPVEAGRESRFGDGLTEVHKHSLHNKHTAIFVAPTFAALPWYADHPTDAQVRQEAYFLNVVVPFVEKTYPALDKPEGRLLLGFSKSGWGAWTLLLRNGNTFGKAAAWDAPLAMEQIGMFGNAGIFGTQENFERYRPADLLRAKAGELRGDPRLLLLGYGNFRGQHLKTQALLDELRIPHVYRDGPQRKHDWHSGWVSEAVGLLFDTPAK